ncbi:sugar transporter [Boeremia exigua]|uniref:sugar transporter n=1 Tax=Boeremia exigua TaxID=749465 RepID=UPI001E8E6F27|nr:sugar transporter [Boeremia exigua]KAH6622004.1 sugar transporter [Boeremia exigua]
MAGPTDLSELPSDDVRWYKRPYLLKLNFVILSLMLFSSTGGYDGSVMGSLLALKTWYGFMGEPAGAYLGWINACYILASGIAFPIGAWMSEKYGRKSPVWLGYMLLIPGVIMQATAQSERVYTYARMLLGTGGAFFMVATPVLINEIALPKHRSIASALFMCGYYVGGTMSSWVVYGTRVIDDNWSWRIPTLLQLVCPALAFVGFYMAPESPRWLISVGRLSDARRMLATWHAGGDENAALVEYQMIEIETAIAVEKESSANVSYTDMFKTPGNRHRLFITVTLGIFSQWAGNGVVSYYLPLMLNTVGITAVSHQTLISACLNVWNLLFALAASLNVDRLGRRFLFLLSATTMLVSFIIITGLSGSFASSLSPSVGVSVIPFIFIFFAGYDVALTPFLSAYPCEIWQFSLRSRGLTVGWVSAFCALFFNIFVNAIALDAIGWKYYFFFIAVLVVMLITVYLTYPETRGHTLEQMAVIFDKDAAAMPPPSQVLEKAEILRSESVAESKPQKSNATIKTETV